MPHSVRETPDVERIRQIPISLIRGGSFYRIEEKASLIHPRAWDLQRRVPAAIAIAWLPLFVLAAFHGGIPDLRALLVDYRVYARVFVAIPMLLLAQVTMETRFRDMAQHFLDANIVRIDELSRYRRIMQKTRRLRDARLPDILIIIGVYAQVAYLFESGRVVFAAWAFDASANGLTPAGYYSLLVSQALFLALLFIAAWKWIIWVYVLQRTSRLRLQLDATNGDLTAGLGFLSEVPKAFVPLVFALSTVMAANFRTQVLTGQTTLDGLKWPAVVFVAIMLLVFFLPLAVFTPALVREKRVSTRRYGTMQHLVSLQFREKWTNQPNEQVARLLDGPDVSSLADLSTSFANIEQMRTFPFRKSTAIAFLLALALPMLPVVTTQIPLKEVMKQLLEAVH
jgi:hypothetical protein